MPLECQSKNKRLCQFLGFARASNPTRTWSFGRHTLRNLAELGLGVFFTLIEIEDCNKDVMDLLVETEELLSPSNVFEALE